MKQTGWTTGASSTRTESKHFLPHKTLSCWVCSEVAMETCLGLRKWKRYAVVVQCKLMPRSQSWHVTQYTAPPHAQEIFIFLNRQSRRLCTADTVWNVIPPTTTLSAHFFMSKDSFRHCCEGVENAFNQLCHNSQGSVKDTTVLPSQALQQHWAIAFVQFLSVTH